MRIRPAGTFALLLECRDADEVEAWRRELWRRRDAGDLRATDIVPGARTILIDGVPPGTAELLSGWPSPTPVAGSSSLDDPIVIPVTFDGDDLPTVADLWGVEVDEVVERLVATPLAVAFCGFAPGFAYLRGLPEEWAVPRLAAPRPRVPAGAVGLAGPYAGIYPAASPGGWRLIGRTEQTLWDVRREPPALLNPGAGVRLAVA